jgi:hypothetical protein
MRQEWLRSYPDADDALDSHELSALHDVACFIGAALTVENRRAHELETMEHHLRTLEKIGVEPLFVADEKVSIEYQNSFLAVIG